MKMILSEQEILITGGTGSLGKALVKELKTNYSVKGIRIFSRDELKQAKMKQELIEMGIDKNVAFIIGDVRDKDRIELATRGVSIIIHAAAMKRIEICELNPLEAINTNIFGTENILLAAIKNQVSKAILISTDKAVYPINLYGITKAAAEKLFIAGNIYSCGVNRIPKFSVCRYGNVAGSRGSVIPLFREQAKKGTIYITDEKATRFWITLPEATNFVLNSIVKMEGGELFIPEMPSFNIVDLAVILWELQHENQPCYIQQVGLLKGEKLHEVLHTQYERGKHLTSLSNPWKLSKEEIAQKIKEI